MDMGLLELTITAVKSDSDGEQVSYNKWKFLLKSCSSEIKDIVYWNMFFFSPNFGQNIWKLELI